MTDNAAFDLAALQGTWRQTALEENGVLNPPDAYDGALSVFLGNAFEVRALDGALLLNGTFTLDASVMPKAIDWLDATGADAGKCLPAIYDLAGDHFVFVAADPGTARPTVFRAGPGQTLRRFVRHT